MSLIKNRNLFFFKLEINLGMKGLMSKKKTVNKYWWYQLCHFMEFPELNTKGLQKKAIS